MTLRLHPIYVDNREPRHGETFARDIKLAGGAAKIGHLPYGDFRWVCEPEDSGDWWVVTVERKTHGDFVASANDGRLGRFTEEALSAAPTALYVLLLEGDPFKTPYAGDRPWSPSEIDNAVASLETRVGIVVIRSASKDDTGERLAEFWRWTAKLDEPSSLLRVQRPVPEQAYIDPDTRAAVRLLMCLPQGWGEARAKAALRVFGSPWAVLEAVMTGDRATFKEVKGVGPGLVEKARTFLEAQT